VPRRSPCWRKKTRPAPGSWLSESQNNQKKKQKKGKFGASNKQKAIKEGSQSGHRSDAGKPKLGGWRPSKNSIPTRGFREKTQASTGCVLLIQGLNHRSPGALPVLLLGKNQKRILAVQELFQEALRKAPVLKSRGVSGGKKRVVPS